jgi:hypothetical protein
MSLPTIPDGLAYTAKSVAGIGVITTRDWKQGEYVGSFEGIAMLKRDFVRVYGSDIRYTYWTSQNFRNATVRVAKDPRNFITYINERAEPNVGLKRYKLRCLTDIPEGTELLLQYARKYPRDYNLRPQPAPATTSSSNTLRLTS